MLNITINNIRKNAGLTQKNNLNGDNMSKNIGNAANFKNDQIKELALNYVKSKPELSEFTTTHNGMKQYKFEIILRALGCFSRDVKIVNEKRTITKDKNVQYYVEEFKNFIK